MRKIDRLSINRVVHERNGKPREAAVELTWVEGDVEDPTVCQVLTHSKGSQLEIAVLTRTNQSMLYRQGKYSALVERLGEMPLARTQAQELMRSRGIAENAARREMRKLLAQP